MALFGKKKIGDIDFKDSSELPSTFAPELRFPEFPAASNDDNPFREPPRSIEEFRIPEKKVTYESLMEPAQSAYPKPMEQRPNVNLRPFINPQPVNQTDMDMGFRQMPQRPVMGPSIDQETSERQFFHQDKPLFIKIDDYEEAVFTLDKIRAKLKDADRLLEELDKVRGEEERQLEEWKRDLNSIKDKLLIIDKQLFES